MKRKVLMVASRGGHWVQLRRVSPAVEGLQVSYVCTSADVAVELGGESLTVVADANLDTPFKLLGLACQMFWVIAAQRPDFVISTGAAPGFFALMFGKWFGARTIWIDSLANADRMSVSGEKVRRFADLWLTQWPHLETPDGPRYAGAVL